MFRIELSIPVNAITEEKAWEIAFILLEEAIPSHYVKSFINNDLPIISDVKLDYK